MLLSYWDCYNRRFGQLTQGRSSLRECRRKNTMGYGGSAYCRRYMLHQPLTPGDTANRPSSSSSTHSPLCRLPQSEQNARAVAHECSPAPKKLPQPRATALPISRSGRSGRRGDGRKDDGGTVDKICYSWGKDRSRTHGKRSAVPRSPTIWRSVSSESNPLSTQLILIPPEYHCIFSSGCLVQTLLLNV